MRRFKVGVVLFLPLFVLVTILASLPRDPVRAQGFPCKADIVGAGNRVGRLDILVVS